MYKLVTIEESVRIPPNLFGKKLSEAALDVLREQYERTVNKDLGIIVSLGNAKIKSPGKVIPGDGAAYFTVAFDALVFVPKVNEIIDGEVSEIVEFGAFVRLGPVDGLIHVSQVANEFLSFDKKQNILVGKQSRRSLRKADKVRAKIATVSLKDSIPSTKIALTMRPEGLGKIGVAKKKKGKEKEAKEKEEKEKEEKEGE